MIPSASEPGTPVRTATEWTIRMEQDIEENSEMLQEFSDEVVKPCIMQTVELMRHNNEVPAQLVVDDVNFKVELQAMEERSKRAGDLQRLTAWMEVAGRIPPEIAVALVPWAKALNKAGRILGQQDVQFTTQEYAEMLAARDAAANQQQPPNAQ